MPKQIMIFFSLLCFTFFYSTPVKAQSKQPAQDLRALTSDNMQAFVDRFMEEQMAILPVPGAAVVVIHQDSVLLSKGYGMANLDSQLPVDADGTLFRVGSISKLFTATAVMQLVERGEIELDQDINDYLQSIQIESDFEQPITVEDLLLHTAGFDDVFFGMHVRSAEEVQPLSRFVDEHLPNRYLSPGELISYNDHGYTLAGLLVEEVSGIPFDRYVESNILLPLQMTSSTFAQPISDEYEKRLAVGYRFDGETFQPYELDYLQVSPSAGLIGPAAEIAHFMSAHLNDGEYQGTSILSPATVLSMQEKQVANHPELRGRGYGFSEWFENGHRAVFHDGGNPGFLNRMMIFPEEQVGFFITFNGDQYTQATRFHREFTTQFADQFLPEINQASQVTPIELDRPLDDFAGYYRDVTGYSHDTLQKVDSLMNQFKVAAADGHLHVFGREYVPVDTLVFKSIDGESTIAFRENEQGDIEYLLVGTGASAKVTWYEMQPVQFGIVGGYLVLFCLLLFVPLWLKGSNAQLSWSMAIASLINLIFLIGIGALLFSLDVWEFSYGIPQMAQRILYLPFVAIIVLLFIGWQIWISWHQFKSIWTKSIILISTGALLTFPTFLAFWNMLGIHQ